MARVRTGLERLLDRPEPVRGRRVGLVVNPSSITPDLEHASVALARRRGVRVAALFGPEHGIAADAQDLVEVGHSRDRETGLPVYSLYGETRVPTPEMLAGVDAMVYDVQDVGSRYYTFVYTMLHVMEACAREGKRVVVLDRPNPIGGDAVDGNVLDPAYRSFVGMHPLAVRHGMTAGELALMFREELALDVDLHVVPMKGWRRAMAYEDTGLPWVLPSPNIPTVDTAFVYPGGCLVEGTNLSEGRGTTRPFELVGAPWLDGHALARDAREGAPSRGRLPRRRLHPDVPEARRRALPRRPGPRLRPSPLPGLPRLPSPRPARAAAGPRALRLARPSLRVRAREAALRHPVRDRPRPEDDRGGRLAEAARRRVAEGAGGVPPAPGEVPALLSPALSLSPYLRFRRDEWAALRADTPLTLADRDLDRIHGLDRADVASRDRGDLPAALAPAQPARRPRSRASTAPPPPSSATARRRCPS